MTDTFECFFWKNFRKFPRKIAFTIEISNEKMLMLHPIVRQASTYLGNKIVKPLRSSHKVGKLILLQNNKKMSEIGKIYVVQVRMNAVCPFFRFTLGRREEKYVKTRKNWHGAQWENVNAGRIPTSTATSVCPSLGTKKKII